MSFLSAPIAGIFASKETECGIEGHHRIESAAGRHFIYLQVGIIPESFHRVTDPVIVDELAEIPSGEKADDS